MPLPHYPYIYNRYTVIMNRRRKIKKIYKDVNKYSRSKKES